jgi:hypothetical protein
MADMAEKILSAAPLPANEMLERALILPERKCYAFLVDAYTDCFHQAQILSGQLPPPTRMSPIPP